PGQLPAGLTVAGAACGRFTLEAALREGSQQGRSAAADCGFAVPPAPEQRTDPETTACSPVWSRGVAKGKAFVDFQNDVAAGEAAPPRGEGVRGVAPLKPYTRFGMATERGKPPNVTGNGMMAALGGVSRREAGPPFFRPPYTPVAIGALAGHH